MWATTPEHRQQRVSLPDALDLAERCTAFSAVAHYMTGTFEVSDEHLAEELPVASVSVGTMSILGMTLQTGRYFEAGDERYDTEQVVMISDALWERRFQRRPQAVGSSLNVRGTPRTIIGVLGEHQDLLPTVDGETRRFPVWTPFEPRTVPRRLGLVHVLARVRDQVTLAQAQVELDVVASQLAQEYPASNGDRRFRLVQLADQIFGSLRTGMLLLLGAIGLVTLIATSNVLNILLAGAIERQRATALRLAIGARRAAIGSRLLLEGLLLAVAGGATGLVVATWSLGALRALAPPGIPRIDEAGVDLATLVFAVLLTLLIGLVLGCASAFEVLRIRSAAVLDHRQWGPRGLGGRRASELLVVGQIGVAVLLLVGAGLMIRSFAALLAVDPGLAVDRVLTIRMRPGPAAEDADLERQLKERIEALPDVRAFGTIGYLPFGHPGWEISISSDGDGPHASSGTGHDAFVQIVSPGCFDALGIRLLEGRRFTFDDLSDGSRNAVVSESLASKFWPDQSPIGRELTPGIYAEPAPHRVVGVGNGHPPTLPRLIAKQQPSTSPACDGGTSTPMLWCVWQAILSPWPVRFARSSTSQHRPRPSPRDHAATQSRRDLDSQTSIPALGAHGAVDPWARPVDRRRLQRDGVHGGRSDTRARHPQRPGRHLWRHPPRPATASWAPSGSPALASVSSARSCSAKCSRASCFESARGTHGRSSRAAGSCWRPPCSPAFPQPCRAARVDPAIALRNE